MKWIWPLCWYYRIKQLEREADALITCVKHWREQSDRWEGLARGAAVAQCGMTAAYVSAVTAIAASYSQPQPDKQP